MVTRCVTFVVNAALLLRTGSGSHRTSLLDPFYLLTGGRAAERRLAGCSFQGSSYANACFERTRGKQGG